MSGCQGVRVSGCQGDNVDTLTVDVDGQRDVNVDTLTVNVDTLTGFLPGRIFEIRPDLKDPRSRGDLTVTKNFLGLSSTKSDKAQPARLSSTKSGFCTTEPRRLSLRGICTSGRID